jgi:hypothetical protein
MPTVIKDSSTAYLHHAAGDECYIYVGFLLEKGTGNSQVLIASRRFRGFAQIILCTFFITIAVNIRL